MKKKAPDIQNGDIFEDMLVLGEDDNCQIKSRYYLVECQKCHRQKSISRGCLLSHKGTNHSACAHGLRNTVKRFHNIWQRIRSRTTNPNVPNYQWYGGKGINSDAFRYFIDFYDTMYESYKQACELYGEKIVSIDRIDCNSNYEPSNCRWIRVNDQQGHTTRQRFFEAISPLGQKFIANNQRKFANIYGLSDKQINACLSGRFRTHFGWTFKYIECNDYPEIAQELKEVALGVRPMVTIGE